MNYPSIFNYLPPSDLNRLMEKYGGSLIRKGPDFWRKGKALSKLKGTGEVLELKPPWLAEGVPKAPAGHVVGRLGDAPTIPSDPSRLRGLMDNVEEVLKKDGPTARTAIKEQNERVAKKFKALEGVPKNEVNEFLARPDIAADDILKADTKEKRQWLIVAHDVAKARKVADSFEKGRRKYAPLFGGEVAGGAEDDIKRSLRAIDKYMYPMAAVVGGGVGAFRGSLTTKKQREESLKGGPISRAFGKNPVAFTAATGAVMAPAMWSLSRLPLPAFIPAVMGAAILPPIGMHYLDKALLKREQEKKKTAADSSDMNPYLRGAGAVGAGVVGAGLGSLAGIGMLEGAKSMGLIPPRAGAALGHKAVRWGIPLLGTGMGLAYNLYKHYELEELKRALESHKDRSLGRSTGR